MGYLVGVDEAGYGPRLGPLVIAASVWHVPGDPGRADLYQQLAGGVTATPGRQAGECVVVCDSKQLYRPPYGLTALERNLLAVLALVDLRPRTWSSLWPQLAPRAASRPDDEPWTAGFDLALPTAADPDEIERAAEHLAEHAEREAVRLVAVEAVALAPARVNHASAACGSKAQALSEIALDLVARLIEPLADEPIKVVCDRHGGRAYYQSLLQAQWPDTLIEIRREAADDSIYRWGPPSRRVECRFQVGGERFLPTALASMTAKYLRELSMLAFNRFWCAQVPSLRPTAGYAQDANRFKRDIAQAQAALAIGDDLLWRVR